MSDATGISIDHVRQAIADCEAAGRRPGMRPVWRAIVERTGKRPSFSTVARYLAEVADGVQVRPTAPAGPPDQVVAQLQQLAPAVWQAASTAARHDLAAELQALAERLRAAAERERDLLAELDEAQARATAADEQRQEAVQRAAALQERSDAQAASVQALAEAQRSAAELWSARERELSARLAQLEREGATLAAAGNHAREAQAQAAAACDRLQDELREAQRRMDADLALNAHLREQLATRDEDIRALREQLAAASTRERASAVAAAAAEMALRRRDPVIREMAMSLRRLQAARSQGQRISTATPGMSSS
jgi:chromosome segregation ATPase